MAVLSDLFEIDKFREMQDAGFVRVQRHPDFPNDIAITNYTHKAQSNYHWNSVTEQTRGLIYNPKTLEIIARPLRKFYNYGEKNADPITAQEHVVAYDKVDGSLGIAYPIPGTDWEQYAIATRGSFTSEQAVWATEKFMRGRDPLKFPFIPHYTDLFEIIYPDNRIVVQYGEYEGLKYLGTVENETGRFIFEDDMFDDRVDVIYEGVFEGVHTLLNRENAEGVVVVTSDNRRVKLKQQDYVDMHRIVSNLSAKSVWEAMDGPNPLNLEALVANIPEEHAEWAREIGQGFISAYVTVSLKLTELYHATKDLKTRKQKALYVKDELPVVKAAFFLAIDKKDYAQVVWKYLEPKGE
jgi:RNA ligase